jgi:hypothetical protein
MIGLDEYELDTRTAAERQTDFLFALRCLMAFLETHPDVPFEPQVLTLTGYVTESTDEQGRARIDEIAAWLEVTATWRNGYYVARREFGDGMVAYEAIYVPAGAGKRG